MGPGGQTSLFAPEPALDPLLCWLWLAHVMGPASSHAGRVLDAFGGAQEAWEARDTQEFRQAAGLAAAKRAGQLTPEQYQGLADRCRALGVRILPFDDPDYPLAFSRIPDMPLVLYCTGDPVWLNEPGTVGIVGSRKPTDYGLQAAADIGEALARSGALIVSGLADGLDSEAHRAAVQADVPTVAFLGTAIDKTYPASNTKLRTAIEKGGGAVCSEYPPGYSGRTTGTFLARNRLIAAQSEALCVAEARTRSGTLNTVGHAERLGRPVLAVPGSIYSALSEGTNELLRTHRAEPLCKAADALDILGIGAETAAPAQQRFDPATVSADAQAVYAVLKPTPQSIDALCAAASLPAGRVLAACTELELMGGAQAQPGRRYIAL